MNSNKQICYQPLQQTEPVNGKKMLNQNATVKFYHIFYLFTFVNFTPRHYGHFSNLVQGTTPSSNNEWMIMFVQFNSAEIIVFNKQFWLVSLNLFLQNCISTHYTPKLGRQWDNVRSSRICWKFTSVAWTSCRRLWGRWNHKRLPEVIR